MKLELYLPNEIKATIRDALASLLNEPFTVPRLTVSKDLLDYWEQELKDAIHKNVETFVNILDSEQSVLDIPNENIDDVLKACSALRLHLRKTKLNTFQDEEIESLRISRQPNLSELASLQLYRFLVIIQTSILDQIK